MVHLVFATIKFELAVSLMMIFFLLFIFCSVTEHTMPMVLTDSRDPDVYERLLMKLMLWYIFAHWTLRTTHILRTRRKDQMETV